MDRVTHDPRITLADIRRHVIGLRRAAAKLPPSAAGPLTQSIVRLLRQLDDFGEELDPGARPPRPPGA